MLQTKYLRPVIALALTVTVCYLALRGNEIVISSITGAFAVLAGALWGERAALKVPGVNNDPH